MNKLPLVRIIRRTEPLDKFLKRYEARSLKIMEGAYFTVPGFEHIFGKVKLSQYEVANLDDISAEKVVQFHVSWVEVMSQENQCFNALYLHKNPLYSEEGADFEWRNLKHIEVVRDHSVIDWLISLGANSLILDETKKIGFVEGTKLTFHADKPVYSLNFQVESELNESLVVSKLYSKGKFISYLLHMNDDAFWENLDLSNEVDTTEHFYTKAYPAYRSLNPYPENWDDILGDEEAGAAYWNLD